MGRHGRARRSHRVLVVAVSAAVTVAACAGYLAADLTDRAPGLLTARAADVREPAAPPLARTAGDTVGDVRADVPIDRSAAAALVDRLASASGVGPDVSVVIADATGAVAAERASGTPREPASVTKTLTAYAASSTLDMGSSIATETLLDTASGTPTVTLRGNGDMLLGAGDSDPDHVNGHAGLGTLAADTADALARQGVRSVALRYDDTLFGDDRSPAGIEDNDGGGLYYTPISTMAVDGGRRWGTMKRPADPDDSGGYPPLSPTPAADAAAAFAARLGEHGIQVTGTAPGRTPDAATPLARVDSAQLGQVLAFMLRHSDNTLAELFGRLVALKLGTGNTSAGDAAAVRKVLDSAGVSTEGLTLTSCSGLAPGTTMTVTTLVDVQHLLVDPDGGGAAALEGLSVPGLVGTARGRVGDGSAVGLARVKTGSLTGVTSLTGNVSRRNGGILCFAVIVNHAANQWEASKAIDGFVASLAGL